MSVSIDHIDDIVDPLEAVDVKNASTEYLERYKSELEGDIDSIEDLILELKAFMAEAAERIHEVEQAIYAREDDEVSA
jgi:hypothetical protein